jgi:hypothetical protein
MGYKVLGYLVWQGGKWYVRRRFQGTARKAAIAGLGGVVLIGGALVAQRRAADD